MSDLSTPLTAERLPLGYEQDWYQANTRGGTGAHKNVRISFRILGPLVPEALDEVVRRFTARHDALQLQPLPGPDGTGTTGQYLRPLGAGEPVMLRESVTARSAEQFSRYASALLSRDFTAPWAGDGDRPFRVRLLRYEPDHHALLATFQNLVFDGRAHHLFASELWRDYQALVQGDPVPDTAPSFAAAVARQRTGFGPEHLARARASWRKRLEFAARHPWRQPASAAPTEGGTLRIELPARAWPALRERCAEARCSVSQWVIAAFVRAVAGQAGLRRVALWTTMDSRGFRDRDLVGMLAGTCPVAVRDPAAALPAVLAEVRARLLEALRYQQLTAAELHGLAAELAAGGGASLARDIFVSLRRFDGEYPVTREQRALRITADAYPLRRIAFTGSAALHLRCTEFRDRLLIDLTFDGPRVGRLLAQAIADQLGNDLMTDRP
ncbi:hypothetical protein E6W39_00235 [Kitasatospora acidiphila]|uniref:Condensation domain-containing protein n=1 Tax=Kitasatospora acidiphila TaxID=2567942 RepID=A0A540WG78_9ACTN|nr:condensation domain-containing protein [Kitasatospora acidiphila]TQF08025.1 hypothetical protein E6W39_00235 [Kitasatospora acidiphila]